MKPDIIHRSKIGLEILIPIVLVLGTLTTIMIINLIWVGIAVCGLIIWFVVNIYTKTYYKITIENRLLLKCGILESFDIAINDIEWIRKADDLIGAPLINSPALSLDR